MEWFESQYLHEEWNGWYAGICSPFLTGIGLTNNPLENLNGVIKKVVSFLVYVLIMLTLTLTFTQILILFVTLDSKKKFDVSFP